MVDEELSADKDLAHEKDNSFDIPSAKPSNKNPVTIEDSDQIKKSQSGSSQQLCEHYTEVILAMSIPSVDSYISTSECESLSSSVSKNKKRTFKTNPGKKRTRCTEKWIDNRRKALLNCGKQYVSRNGKVKNKKALRPVCTNSCKLKCFDKFDLATRQNIHLNFWKLADHCKQWEFINKFTEKQNKKRITTEGPSRRQFTTKYFLPLPTDNLFKPQQVCLKTFLNTLCITDQFVRTAQSKMNQEGITLPDNRGKHSNHPVAVDSSMIKSVCDHVASFQPIESDYIRKNTSKLYLDNNLTMNRMFALYKEWDQLSRYDTKAQTIRQYRDIINSNSNLFIC